MKVTELQRCPFCNGRVSVTNGLTGAPFLFFKCQNAKCGAIVSFDNMECNLNPKLAVKAWNRRADNE